MSELGAENPGPWTAPQWAAIAHVGGDLLVSAAAGSGKTAVLAERCARLVCDEVEGGCGVEGLLVLTFTEAAATEMRERIAKAIQGRLKSGENISPERMRWLRRQGAMVDRAAISTLHAFCARVLRAHFAEVGIDPAFELMDEEEARLMREDALDEVIGKWHGGKCGMRNAECGMGESGVDAFAEFFEGYGQGKDGNVREMVLGVYRMLASVERPGEYVERSRRVYSVEGRGETVERYVRLVIGGRLRMLLITARRAVEEAGRGAGYDAPIVVGLKKVLELLEGAEVELERRGAEGIEAVREALTDPWPARLTTMKDVDDFKGLKDRTWEVVKKRLKKFCDETLEVDVVEMGRDLGRLGGSLEVLLGLVEDFMGVYGEMKGRAGRLDFSDLERLTLDLLSKEGSVAAGELRARFCHVLVDEFQDINPLQAALLEAVRSGERFEGRGNLFVVGDVKQSIYGFRLADPELFLERERGARGVEGRFVGLPHNFRSQGKLLEVMNGVFERVMTREVVGVAYGEGHALEKFEMRNAKCETELRVLDGGPVEVHLVVMDPEEAEEEEDGEEKLVAENFSAVEEEARVVARRIKELMGEGRGVTQKDGTVRGLEYRDVAILLRSLKSKAMIFSRALAREGVPCHADLSTGYFDAAEVRDTLALLQVLDNPLQDIPLATVMLGPYGRFSHDDLARVRLGFDRKLVSFAEGVRRFAREGTPPEGGTPNELAGRLGEFLGKLGRWREWLRTRPLHEGLSEIYGESRIIPYVAGLEAGGQRVANLQALQQRALKFSGFAKQGLHRFLRFVEKLRDQEGDFGEAPVLSEASNVVRIMSVHKSKGLEFPVVVVAGLGGLLNLRDVGAGGVKVHRDLGIGLPVVDVERNVVYPSAISACIQEEVERSSRAEELRLLYVAMTRARDHLILSGHVGKEAGLEKLRAGWKGHEGALPEDVLMKGRTGLEWVVPALECGGLRVEWGEKLYEGAQVVVRLHSRARGAGEFQVSSVEFQEGGEESVRRVLAGGDDEGAGKRVIARVMGRYGFEELTKSPAVRTVSQLKREAVEEEGAVVPVAAVRGVVMGGGDGEEARMRGIATHRVLELLDFSACAKEGDVARQVAGMVAAKKISAEEAGRADAGGIEWFVLQSEVGRRVVRGVRESKGVIVRRELAFTWAAPVEVGDGGEAADWPTIRGTMDLLMVDRERRWAEIVDYKTDSVRTWEGNVAGYEVQMGYYLRAAADILGFGVERATLVFLGARVEREVIATD